MICSHSTSHEQRVHSWIIWGWGQWYSVWLKYWDPCLSIYPDGGQGNSSSYKMVLPLEKDVWGFLGPLMHKMKSIQEGTRNLVLGRPLSRERLQEINWRMPLLWTESHSTQQWHHPDEQPSHMDQQMCLQTTLQRYFLNWESLPK